MSSTNETLSVQIASALNEAKVSCVFWGQYAQVICGSFEDVDYKVSKFPKMMETYADKLKIMTVVVPDNMVDRATQTLLASGAMLPFATESCTDNERCSREHDGLLPARLLHLKSPGALTSVDAEFSIEIFAQSTVLWTLPPIENTLLPPPILDEAEFSKVIGPTYLLASDSTALPGIHATGKHPVLVPTPEVQLEGYFRILARSIHEGAEKDLLTSLYGDIARLVRHVYRLEYLHTERLSSTARELLHQYQDRSIKREDWEKILLEVY